jgi:hypothetical protein
MLATALLLGVAGTVNAAGDPPELKYTIEGGIAGMIIPVMRITAGGRVQTGGTELLQLEPAMHRRLIDGVRRLAERGIQVPGCADCLFHIVTLGDRRLTIASSIGGATHVRQSDPARTRAFAALYTLLDLAPEENTAAGEAAGACADALQGRIAWNHRGDKRWPAARLEQLCADASDSVEPAQCFETIMAGEVDWGGGTRWNPRNALTLCSATAGGRR